MGKHFDSLIETIKTRVEKGHSSEHIKDYRSYLEKIINNCALFELPIDPKDLLHVAGKNQEEFVAYWNDYMEMSKKYGEFVLTPFPMTAIEDNVSVVMMDKLGGNRFLFTMYLKGFEVNNDLGGIINKVIIDNSISSLVTGYVELIPSGEKTRIDAYPEFYANFHDDGRDYFNSEILRASAKKDLGYNANAYIEEIIYIMDPENFIIEKESNQSRGLRERKEKHGGKINNMNKTVMRPHYTCLSECDLRDFALNESTDPIAAHPVRGHIRKLMSEKFVKMQGQSIYIKQYFTGEGKIKGKNGWNYEVYVKEAPNKLTAYSQIK